MVEFYTFMYEPIFRFMNHLAMYRIQIISIVFMRCYLMPLAGQELQQVWADEFEGSVINEKYWSYDIGPTNDNIHYYTDRPENAQIVSGVLQIRALEESYEGYNYTSAHLSTKKALAWKYGRFEAHIRLPGSKGFVPAFWMLPVDNRYGWWPYSGEIDIMEHPSNEVVNIYGTVHTEAYNLFSGSGPPQGDHIAVEDAEDAFHLYAVEWSPAKIDFFVDDQLYYTYTNDGGSTDTWPFNHPFYLILNVSVGGGWVGDPDETSVFPAVMEVDYVRVYQFPGDMALSGSDFSTPDAGIQRYFAPRLEGADFTWSLPNRAEIVSGQGTSELEVDWDIFGGFIELESATGILQYPVEITNNLLKNGSLENGVKYWNGLVRYPVQGDFTLSSYDQADGEYSVFVDVSSPGDNPWDVQLSQEDILLESSRMYTVSFNAKAPSGNGQISAALIHPDNFSVFTQQSFTLTGEWSSYSFDFTASATTNALFNIDMGDHAGSYYFDSFALIPAGIESPNQVRNADFSQEDEDWTFTSYSPAVASGEAFEGEYYATITNPGDYLWDVNLSQGGLKAEQDFLYTVSFDARASGSRKISSFIARNSDPWTVYSGEGEFLLSTRRHTFSYSFTMESGTDNDARIGFDMGEDPGTVVIDNVFLSKGGENTAINPISRDYIGTDYAFSITPNPFTESTSIAFRLEVKNHVKIEVYDMLGNRLDVIQDCQLPAGDHHIHWNAGNTREGLFVICLTVGGRQYANKVWLRK